MRKIIAITHLTLDGIMQGPGGSQEDPRNNFTHGGWVMQFGDEVVGEALREIMAGEFDLLLGRRTYEIWAPYWPFAGDNFIGNAFNRVKKYVATRSLRQLDWANSHVISGDTIEGIRQLKASDGPELHVWGSSELLQSLIAADLVDEFRVWVYPVILGQGLRLFETGVPPRGLALVESRRGSKGVFFNTYRPTGPVPLFPDPDKNPSAAELARRKKLATEA